MSSLLTTVIFVGGLVGLYFVIKGEKIPFLDDIFSQLGLKSLGLGSGGGGGKSAGGGASIGAGSGAISSSGTCVGTPLTRDTSNNREEWESKSVPWDAYEVTWCGTFSGDDLTFKLYGPSHSGSACCWCVMHVTPAGKMIPGGEGPHPSSNCQHPEGSKGGSGVAPCYKAVMRPGGPIQEGYALVNGKWELRAEYKGPCGCSKKSAVKTGNTLMVRNDGTANTKCASVQGLGSASAGAGAKAGYTQVHQILGPDRYVSYYVATT